MRLSRLTSLVLVTLAGCGADQDAARPPSGAFQRELIASPTAQSLEADTTLASALSTAFRRAVNRALPALVFVAVERDAPAASQPVPDLFRRFFDLPEGDQEYEPPPQRTTGSGFVYDDAGHILTNHHVVVDASFVMVTLSDGREFEATVEGADPATDLAILSLADDPPLLRALLGNSDEVEVGDWVLALGNPLGLDHTVTAGIISAKGRQLGGTATSLQSYLQTDAAINPGNSGGPLIDLEGRVVGINTLIYGADRFVGYGFAVPITLANRVVSDLLEYGHVRRPRLGVRVSDVTAVDAEAYDLDEVFGAEVNTVEEDSPGERAGLMIGDVIVALDGDPVPDANTLVTGLAQRRPGDRVVLTLLREGRRLELPATLGEFARDGGNASAEDRVPEAPTEERLGFSVGPLTDELARRFGHERDGGVVVTDVRDFSPAARAGVRPGQVVLRLEGTAVTTVRDVERLAADLSLGEAVSLRVLDPELGETIINFRSER